MWRLALLSVVVLLTGADLAAAEEFDDFSANDDSGWLSDLLWNFFSWLWAMALYFLTWLRDVLLWCFFELLAWVLEPAVGFAEYVATLFQGAGPELMAEDIQGDQPHGSFTYWCCVLNLYLPVTELLTGLSLIAAIYATVVVPRLLIRLAVKGLF